MFSNVSPHRRKEPARHGKSLNDTPKIVYHSTRDGDDLDAAISWCSCNGIVFDAINDNLPEVIERYGTKSRKISCDYYIDDKSISGTIYKLLEGI